MRILKLAWIVLFLFLHTLLYRMNITRNNNSASTSSISIFPLCFLSVSLRLVCCGLDVNICRQNIKVRHIIATCGPWPAAAWPSCRLAHTSVNTKPNMLQQNEDGNRSFLFHHIICAGKMKVGESDVLFFIYFFLFWCLINQLHLCWVLQFCFWLFSGLLHVLKNKKKR